MLLLLPSYECCCRKIVLAEIGSYLKSVHACHMLVVMDVKMFAALSAQLVTQT